jgi:PLD-like domain
MGVAVMRNNAKANGISVHAIAGSHAVLLAMNATPEACKGLAGFAIGTSETDGLHWLKGFKFFKTLEANPSPGQRRSTLNHPVQSFLWGHYSAKPGTRFDYVVRPLYFPENGDIGNLLAGTDMLVSITTENNTGTDAVYFNRGAIVSQGFADKFGNKRPDDVNDINSDEVKWLSRGLIEAAIAYIDQANGPDFELRCCFYELTYMPILDALKRAAESGTKVQIIYEAGHVSSDGIFSESDYGINNEAAIAEYKNTVGMKFHKRTKHISIPHNKFMVLREGGVARQVWTGSTNISASGFIGQTNVGHVVRDTGIAGKYDAYWTQLSEDPDRKTLKTWVKLNNPLPKGPLEPGSTTVVFSPRSSTSMLDWYGQRMDEATQTVIMTAAFGVTKELAEHFNNDRDYLRFLLMERKNDSEDTQKMLERDKDTRIALGMALGKTAIKNKIAGWKLDEWLLEESHYRTQGNIFYVHTKIMIIDPFKDNCMIFTGSANFSPSSQNSNDENMLLIQGNTKVADIYTTEFFRLFNHFYFRTVANAVAQRGHNNDQASHVVFLDATDNWTKRNFEVGSYHERRRKLFGVDPE